MTFPEWVAIKATFIDRLFCRLIGHEFASKANVSWTHCARCGKRRGAL